ncbi:NAD-dependent epimerase/dehydratase family protein [Actinoplanes sp. NPDC049118]|uniref:NAD-dependent epimerase/dehydratase family protein n=1 Tax=Actinoplanes sp. NPDC049118 TaxID=3155769 RepID=UPI0033F7FE01
MKVIIFGATGMVGQGALRESLLAADVEQVLAVGRRPTGVRHPKLREVTTADFADLTPIEDDLRGYDACFYCLGVSSVGLSEAEYTRISYDYPVAAAHLLARLNPETTFLYVSGAGTNPDGRAMWARVKGRTEVEVIKTFPNGYAMRPAFIQPTHGATSRTGLYRALYTATAPLMPLLGRLVPRYVTSTDRLGRAMLRAARTGFPTHVVENADLR